MIEVRRSDDRGHADHGWLDTRYTFSFADYFDPEHVGFRVLRVINEDRVAPGTGFPLHPHRDMEIVTYVLAGAIAHEDSMGNASVLRAGEIQRMTAGTGVRHSEANPSDTETLHLLQIWILPERAGLEPGYEQRPFPDAEKAGRLRPIVSPDGRDGSLSIHQDVTVLAAILAPGEGVTHEFGTNRHGWIQVARGAVALNGERLAAGDGAAISDEPRLAIEAAGEAEVLLFDLP